METDRISDDTWWLSTCHSLTVSASASVVSNTHCKLVSIIHCKRLGHLKSTNSYIRAALKPGELATDRILHHCSSKSF